ncbi:MAG: hypothetical protein CM1200mP3_13260 [Chloroflexota bacterium]|nr:MAG: hypothetical protein CM1200mP3_13260 [Chloroflexota bacterium]
MGQRKQRSFRVNATGGELGTLGTGGLVIKKENLALGLRNGTEKNLAMYGCNPPFMLRYRDQELEDEEIGILSRRFWILSI